jgi:prepilin-type N-terminal cleavage/methylation domain-containing protein/prepilin-type processing-associated H-X9-DG protein
MRRLRAFTLIELLVVIAIIALLMAVLMPALSKAKNLAQGAACRGNLKGYTFAVHMYAGDNDDKFCNPDECYFSSSSPYPVEAGLSNHLELRWANGDLNLKNYPQYGGTLFPYMTDARAFICPTFRNMARSMNSSDDPFFRNLGSSITNFDPWYNYSMNAYLGPANEGRSNLIGGLTNIRVGKLTRVKRASETFVFAEESPMVDTQYNQYGLNNTFMIPGSGSMVEQWQNQVHTTRWDIKPGPDGVGQFWNVIAGFHHAPTGDPTGGRGNCAFVDGHVAAHPRSETFPLAWPR